MPKDLTLSSKNYVIVQAWVPTKDGIEITYPKAVWERTFNPNDHVHIGHVAMTIRHEDAERSIEIPIQPHEQYVSMYPTESHFFTTSPAVNHTLAEDIRDQENLPPTLQAILFSLDTKKMLEEFTTLQPQARWFLSGIKLINPAHEKVYNCSSFAERLLTIGGIYEHLLTPQQKLGKLITPRAVYELANLAAKEEMKLYPQRETVLKEYSQMFSNELIAKSQDKANPLAAINAFLLDNPDFYLRVNKFNPQLLAITLAVVYQNLQNYHDQALLNTIENFKPGTAAQSLAKIDKLLALGANLSLHNSDGENALHLVVKKDCYQGTKRLLEKFPEAVNSETKPLSDQLSPKTPLDIALTIANAHVIRLIKNHGGLTKNYKELEQGDSYDFGLFAIANQAENAAPKLKQDELRKMKI